MGKCLVENELEDILGFKLRLFSFLQKVNVGNFGKVRRKCLFEATRNM